jgi:hypothetical protein
MEGTRSMTIHVPSFGALRRPRSPLSAMHLLAEILLAILFIVVIPGIILAGWFGWVVL